MQAGHTVHAVPSRISGIGIAGRYCRIGTGMGVCGWHVVRVRSACINVHTYHGHAIHRHHTCTGVHNTSHTP